MEVDPLVLWAWEASADRIKPPLSPQEFVAALKLWADAGIPCPR
jgi:hypothetical protein